MCQVRGRGGRVLAPLNLWAASPRELERAPPGERARIRLNSAEIGAPPGRLLWGLAQGSGAHPAPAPWFQALDPLGDPSPVVLGERGARAKPVGSG